MGDSTNRFNTMYATVFDGTATQAQYADLAEKFDADHKYEPGTVLMFGGSHEVTISVGTQNKAVAGVVSEKPAYLMNTALGGDTTVELAMMGRVFCKVIGKIRKGDMLVTSNHNGVAMASEDPEMGTVIGKALQKYDSDEIGEIEIVVGKL
jgi:UDP-N-acetyl-D-mannosaminuronic acid transferase (WecB/TagA/CpsF family)